MPNPPERRGRSLPDIFADALAIPAAEARAAFLEQACGSDAELRAEVESLLRARSAAGDFLMLGSAVRMPPDLTDQITSGETPATVGAYRVVRLLATGGMGSVYLGERTDEAYRKLVAIKVVTPGRWSPEILQRFRTERQVLADLEHPGIARLIDGGSLEGGLPYLVMEYVDGSPINRYCFEHDLDVRSVLSLFLAVCDAVQYAHQNLVIHRDLKPSNILVDRSGRPRLLDFGIAKVLGPAFHGGTADAALTTFQPLTPRYASPEQIAGRRVTTATDIYSLGAVLYELLTGESPYDLVGKTPSAVANTILNAAPVRPSQRAAPERSRRLRGDLDTIVLKALAKEPARRYATVEEFAADVRRHLSGEPVHARPDTAAYRVSKFVRRNKLLVAGTTALVVLLTGAFAVSLRSYREAAHQKAEAEWLAYTASLAATESSILDGRMGEATAHLDTAPPHLRAWEWRHLKARLDRSLRSFRAHPAGVNRIVFAPDGREFVTCSVDSTIRVWRDGSGSPERSWGPFSSGVETASYVPGTRDLALGLYDGSVLVVDRSSGSVRTVRPRDGAVGWAQVSVHPDGTRLASGFLDGFIRVWTLPDGAPVREWQAHDGLSLALYSPDGRYLLTGGGDGNARLHDARSGDVLWEVHAHSRRIYSAAFSPDGSKVVTGSMDRTAAVWSVPDGSLLSTFREHGATVTGLAFDPSGERVVSSGADNRLFFWNAGTGGLEAELHGHLSDVSAVARIPDGSGLVTGDWSGIVKVWAWSTEDVVTARFPPDRWKVPAVIEVATDPRDSLISCASMAFFVPVWPESGGLPSFRLPAPSARRVAFTPDGGQILAGLENGWLHVFSAQGAHRDSARAHSGPVLGLAVEPGGAHAATSSSDSTVRLWSLADLELVRTYRGHAGDVNDIEFAPAGAPLASGGSDGTVRLWNPAEGTLLETWNHEGGAVTDLAFDPRGRYLAVATADGQVTLVDLSHRTPNAVLPRGPSSPTAVAWSSDGTRLASGGGDGVVRLFDVASRRLVLALHGHVGRISSIRFRRADAALLSGSTDGTIRIWQAPGP
jgi:WD40 repeat protein/serine/threonine protein kinase